MSQLMDLVELTPASFRKNRSEYVGCTSRTPSYKCLDQEGVHCLRDGRGVKRGSRTAPVAQ